MRMMDIQDSNNAEDVHEDFLRLFMKDQFRILAFIRAMVHDQAASNDIYQETCLNLWRSFAEFRRDAEFGPWALGIARNQVLRYWRKQGRDRHVFSDSLLEDLSRDAVALAGVMEDRMRALEDCTKNLSQRQQELIVLFYGANQSASNIATKWGRSVHTVYKSLKTMRRFLLDCINSKLTGETVS